MQWIVHLKQPNMNPFSIDIAPFKKQHITGIALSFVPLVIAYVLANKGYSILKDPTVNEVIKWAFLAATLVVSFLTTRQHKEKLKGIHTLPSFEAQVAAYKKLYDQRVMVNVVIGIAAAVFFALTARRIYFIFGMLDLIVLIILYPNKNIFRRELNNEAIDFR